MDIVVGMDILREMDILRVVCMAIVVTQKGILNDNQYNAGTSSTGRLGAFSTIPNVHLVEQKLIRMLNEE
jgi:hypothetical protein